MADPLPVIFLTGHGDVPTAVAAGQAWRVRLRREPFSDNALVDRIEARSAAAKGDPRASWQRESCAQRPASPPSASAR